MGSPIFITVTNLAMEHIETKAINLFFSPLILGTRFVDDT